MNKKLNLSDCLVRGALALLTCAGCTSTEQRLAQVDDPFLKTATASIAAPTATKAAPASTAPRLAQPALLQPASSPPASTQLASTQTASSQPSSSQPPSSQPPSSQPPSSQPPSSAPQPFPPLTLASFEVDEPVQPSTVVEGVPQIPPISQGGTYPIDLANALGLAGADHLQVRLARTRLYQAQAEYFAAKTLWLPSLRFGLGYSKHDGRLQGTEGVVREVSRNSLFVGGGLGLGQIPLPGGAGGPPRLFVTLSVADAAFAPLAACQEVAAQGAAERAAMNDALTDVAVSYHTLVEAQGRLANARYSEMLANRLEAQVSEFEREGFSSQSEISRARAAGAAARRRAADAERQAVAASTALARALRLPPQIQLIPAEDTPLPIHMVADDSDIDLLIAQAWGSRPELAHFAARREAACWRVKHENWRPWMPNVQVGATGGEFGGAPGSDFRNGGSRSDVELLAVWEWRNLGLGNVALQRTRRGELHEAVLEWDQQRDNVAAEVVAAAADVTSYREQIAIAQEAIADAQQSYELTNERIRESEGLPIELLQSIGALTEAQDAYNESVANYNRAQFRLQRAIGTPAQ
ncbi:TolC family protein [Pirellulales bacterium]|nr:TolC family protein [Pirellulales bacterium]